MAAMLGPRDAALAALKAEQAEQNRQRELAQRDRTERERAADEAALEMVRTHPWIAAHLPDVDWVLVTRRFPQNSACVHPSGDPDLWLIVTEHHHDYVTYSYRRDIKSPLVGSTSVRTLAALGQAIEDEARRARQIAQEGIQP